MLRNIALQDCLFSICGIECDYIDELSDAYHCRRICEEGANLLGFEDFEEYLCNVSQPTLLSRSIREGHVCRCNWIKEFFFSSDIQDFPDFFYFLVVVYCAPRLREVWINLCVMNFITAAADAPSQLCLCMTGSQLSGSQLLLAGKKRSFLFLRLSLALLWNPEVATQRTFNRFVSFHKYFCKLIDILRFSYRFYLLTGEAKAVQEPHVWGSFARVLQRLERVSLRVFRWSELSPGIEVWVNFGQLRATRLCLWWRLSASRPLVLELAIGRTEVMSPASYKRTDELLKAMAWSPWS